jgi:hypothetical protein
MALSLPGEHVHHVLETIHDLCDLALEVRSGVSSGVSVGRSSRATGFGLRR